MNDHDPESVTINDGVLTTSLGSWRLSGITSVQLVSSSHILRLLVGIFIATASTWIFSVAHPSDTALPYYLWWAVLFAGIAGSGSISLRVVHESIEVLVWTTQWWFFARQNAEEEAQRILNVVSSALKTSTPQPR